ncbi:hypothetical protein FACS189485_06450 [Spirochaetia bacterium]|nr:hypothetical protein FACS189485_06450 [Spirochaetia bacterium]
MRNICLVICIFLFSALLNAEQVRDHNNNGHIDNYDVARSHQNDYFWRNGAWYYLNQGDINYARNAANYPRQNQKTQGSTTKNGHPVLIIITIIGGIYLTKKFLNYYKEKEYQERLRTQRIEEIRQKETRRQKMAQEQQMQWFEEVLAQKEREYQEQLIRQLAEAFMQGYKRAAPPPKAPPQSDMVSFYRNMLRLRLQFTKNELKNAYREAVKKYHPDKYTDASERDRENAEMLMKQVTEGYEVLNELTKC